MLFLRPVLDCINADSNQVEKGEKHYLRMTKVTLYRFKLTESQLCVAINILNDYRKKHQLSKELNDLILKLIDILEKS